MFNPIFQAWNTYTLHDCPYGYGVCSYHVVVGAVEMLDNREFVYIGIGIAIVLVVTIVIGVCLWHRRRRRELAEERTALLPSGKVNEGAQERSYNRGAGGVAADLSMLDSESWKRIDTWLVEVCDCHARRQIAAIDEPEIEPDATPSASWSRSMHLTPTNDDFFVSTPRNGTSPRVSVGASEGIVPTQRTHNRSPLE